MKTSVMEVRDMLSVLSVDEVERRIGEVPGVESVTVNHAARSATVRYDETRLDVADIKSAVRQRGYESKAESSPEHAGESKPAGERAVVPTPEAAPSPGSAPAAAAPKAALVAPAAMPVPAASPVKPPAAPPAPGAPPPEPAPAAAKAPPVAPATAAPSTARGGH